MAQKIHEAARHRHAAAGVGPFLLVKHVPLDLATTASSFSRCTTSSRAATDDPGLDGFFDAATPARDGEELVQVIPAG